MHVKFSLVVPPGKLNAMRNKSSIKNTIFSPPLWFIHHMVYHGILYVTGLNLLYFYFLRFLTYHACVV